MDTSPETFSPFVNHLINNSLPCARPDISQTLLRLFFPNSNVSRVNSKWSSSTTCRKFFRQFLSAMTLKFIQIFFKFNNQLRTDPFLRLMPSAPAAYCPSARVRSIVINVSVCLPVCLSVCVHVCTYVSSHISKTTFPNFAVEFLHVNCGRGSILLWRHYHTLFTSDFVHDVIFP